MQSIMTTRVMILCFAVIVTIASPTISEPCANAETVHAEADVKALEDWSRDTEIYRATERPWRDWRLTDPNGTASYPLTASRLRASRSYDFDAAPLHRLLRRLEAGDEIEIAVVGGSNTNGRLGLACRTLTVRASTSLTHHAISFHRP